MRAVECGARDRPKDKSNEWQRRIFLLRLQEIIIVIIIIIIIIIIVIIIIIIIMMMMMKRVQTHFLYRNELKMGFFMSSMIEIDIAVAALGLPGGGR